MSVYFLYGTSGCHLCDDAESLLKSMAVPYIKVDIAEQPSMVERLGTKIPVLSPSLKPCGQELYWPFDAEKVAQWLPKT